MFCHYSMLFKQTRSRYIAWNILFLWGFVLWIALCISNMYYSGFLNQQAALFYLQNSYLGITYNVSAKAEAIEDMLQIATTNCNVYKTIVMLKAALQYIYILVIVSFIILFLCSHEYLKKNLGIRNDKVYNVRSIAGYLATLAKTYRKNVFSRLMNDNDYVILQSKVIANPEISTECFGSISRYHSKEDKCSFEKKSNINVSNTGANILQTEIIFNSYTLLLFNNRELYHYFNDLHLKNTLFYTRYSVDRSSEYIRKELTFANNYEENVDTLSKNDMKKGIVSSSPEFQEFLVNLQRSRIFYPYMLEVSASYTIRMKSLYK